MDNHIFRVKRNACNITITYPNGVPRKLCDKVVEWFERHGLDGVLIAHPFVKVRLSANVTVCASTDEITDSQRWHVRFEPPMSNIELGDLDGELQFLRRRLDSETLSAIAEIYERL